MIIYIDILLIENFIINLFLLLVTLNILKYKYYHTIYISSLLGALYTLVLFMDNKLMQSFPFKIIVVFIMLCISTKSFNIKKLIRGFIVFMITSFTLCGITFAFSMMENDYSIFQGFTIDNYSIKYLLISIMSFYIFIVRVTDYLKDRALINTFIYDIEIINDKKSIFIKGLLDTGNSLREPVSNLPCIIIESDYFNSFKIESREEYLIPFNTIGDNGNLVGFKTKEVRIRGEDKEWKDVEVIICKCKNKLSKDNEFNALLSRGVI